MAGISTVLATKVLNASLPTGASGVPGSWTAYNASAMKVRLNSTASTEGSAGTELASGNGYTTGGNTTPNQSTASSAGSAVTVPAVAALSWTASGTSWSIVSFDLTDSTGSRAWYGNFNGQPISVADGNTFQIAVGGLTFDVS